MLLSAGIKKRKLDRTNKKRMGKFTGQRKKIFILVPVLNEAENLPLLIESWNKISEKLSAYDLTYILIDDGSTDDTARIAVERAGKLHVVVLRHGSNMGPGYAFGTGFEYLTGKVTPADFVITMEGDNTSREEIIPTMLDRMIRERYDAIFASPYAYGGGIENTKFIRVFLSHGGNAFVKTMLNIHGIHTMSSFFRLYSGNVILTLQQKYGQRILERQGFESMVELLKKLINVGATISEIPMKLDTSNRKGSSKMKVLRTIRGYFEIYLAMKKW
jgi:dolichol-phosphate mannosyltransferase